MSKNLLLFTGEQWELIRRLRNSGLTQDQICQAYDDLERIERELGNLYNLPFNTNTNNSDNNNSNNNNGNTTTNGLSSTPCTAVNALFADPTLFAKNMQNFQLLMAKNIAALNYRQRIANTDTNSNSSNASSTSNTPAPSNVNTNNQQHTQIETTNNSKNLTNNNNNNNNVNHNSNSSNNTSILNNNNNKNSNDIQDEVKELEEFRTKGDANIHYEISHFVYKYDLKQSQIARMAGVNQAYVSKFLRGDFNDLSENGKTLIYKWYLKFTKNPIMLAKQQNGCNDNNNNNSNNGSDKTSSKLDNFSFVNMVNTYDTPKRTRFSFKPDHLMILEKSFLENAYPDPKKREELARLCNNVRTNGELSDRERVTEQIVTHWFQNKRKLARKSTGDMTGMQTQSSNDETTSFNEQNGDSTPFEYENEIESPLNYQDFMDEAQMAACKAIMSRMNGSPTKSNDFTNDDLSVKLEMM